MINILVPTDFSVESVNWVKAAARSTNAPLCNIVLFHAFAIPDSPFDLLGNQEPPIPPGLLTDSFRLACKQAKDDSGKKIGKIVVRVMRGDSRPLFRNFIDANEIDMIYLPENVTMNAVHPFSIDPLPLFKKCGVPFLRKYPVPQQSSQSRRLAEFTFQPQ